MNRINIYVGCAIKHAPKEFVSQIISIREELEENPHFNVLKFLGDGEPKAIFTRDIQECVAQANVMLAIADLPSTGLGYEMGTHYEKFNRPLFVVAHRDAKVSGLILGIHGEAPFEFCRYDNLSQVPELFTTWLNKVTLV